MHRSFAYGIDISFSPTCSLTFPLRSTPILPHPILSYHPKNHPSLVKPHNPQIHHSPKPTMPPQLPSHKRQKREDYRKSHKDNQPTELPKKKFYRQRAHANPFSDHQLA